MAGCKPLTSAEIVAIDDRIPGLRDKAWFRFGVATGRRISQILSLRIRDVAFLSGNIRSRVYFERRVTKGRHQGEEVILNQDVRDILQDLVRDLMARGYGPEAYLFQSSRGGNKPIDRRTAWRVIREAAELAEIDGKVGTHSMRKSAAVQVWELSGRDLSASADFLGHSDVKSTIHYLKSCLPEREKYFLRDLGCRFTPWTKLPGISKCQPRPCTQS